MRTEPLFSSRLERALRRCAEWHRGQCRKGSETPYMQHVVGVAMVLDRLGFDEDVVIAGLLHDAVEDTEATLDEVAAEFGPAVAAMVADCSEQKLDAQGRKRPWIERKTDHLAVLEAAGVGSRAVALADKLHNLTSILVDVESGRDIWSRFSADRERVFWYYREAIRRYPGTDPRLAALASACQTVLDTIAQRVREKEPPDR